MEKNELIALFNNMHPDFFEARHIRSLPKEYIFDEMILSLELFDPTVYERDLGETVTFGFFAGDINELKAAITEVDCDWLQYFSKDKRIYCGFKNERIASFAIISDLGTHSINERDVRIGGPGCVGTLPQFRDSGIGLTLVKKVTEILKNEGYDYSYIHYTYVASWYEKLGYKVALRWNKSGML